MNWNGGPKDCCCDTCCNVDQYPIPAGNVTIASPGTPIDGATSPTVNSYSDPQFYAVVEASWEVTLCAVTYSITFTGNCDPTLPGWTMTGTISGVFPGPYTVASFAGSIVKSSCDPFSVLFDVVLVQVGIDAAWLLLVACIGTTFTMTVTP
jgi:hypothetical protein